MPPNRLVQRIHKIKRCPNCESSDMPDFVFDAERDGYKRCDCYRGRLLRLSDRIRDGKQVEQQELEMLK